jgi:hypothetical protein
VVKGNVELAAVQSVAVIVSNEICEAMVRLIGIVELAPGNSNIIGLSGYIDTAVTTVVDSAVGDKDIGYPLLYSHTIPIAIAAGVGNV